MKVERFVSELSTADAANIVAPSKIVCVGRNYADHAKELGNEVPAEPIIFLKPPSAVNSPGGTIVLPRQSQRVEFEGELAVVIGRKARNVIAADDAAEEITGDDGDEEKPASGLHLTWSVGRAAPRPVIGA